MARLRKALEGTETAGTPTLRFHVSLSSASIIARAEASDRLMYEATESRTVLDHAYSWRGPFCREAARMTPTARSARDPKML